MSEETANVQEIVKKSKKLSKVAEGTKLTISEGLTGQVLTFDYAGLSAEIKDKLLMHGFSQKLGDAAAGKEGQEAIDAINKVFDGLVKGDFTVRVPAAEKVTKKSIMDKFNEMPDGKEKKMAEALLKNLGILK
jgi:hypothetical protein